MRYQKTLLFASVVVVLGVGLGAMTQPPSDAPPAFREYCAGRCHISPTSLLSGKRAAFRRWARLSRVDRELKLCTMSLNLYDQSYAHYDPSRKGIPLEDHKAIMAYLDHYFNLPPNPGVADLNSAYAADE
jgi:hypothetical protein